MKTKQEVDTMLRASAFNEFKQNCIAAKETRTANEIIWENLYEEQKQYGDEYKMKNRYVGKLRCPNCYKKLTQEPMFVKDRHAHYIMFCDCGYKYACSGLA